MNNYLIKNRLASFQDELLRKRRDSIFAVSETCFICERAALLVQDYSRPGAEPLKTQTLDKLQQAMEQADLYFARIHGKRRQTPICSTHVLELAQEALATFLAKAP